jgi:hypothetical protein
MELTEQQFVAALLRWFGLNEALRSDASFEALRADIERALKDWGECHRISSRTRRARHGACSVWQPGQ